MTQALRLLDALDDGAWHRSDDLVKHTKATRIAARIYDLRKRGILIETRTGAHRFEEYRLAPGRSKTFHELQALRKPASPQQLSLVI